MKVTRIYSCRACSFETPKWLGKCPQCEEWNSFSEQEVTKETPLAKKIKAHARTPKEFESVLTNLSSGKRHAVGMQEIDRVLGGGFVSGSLVLLTGEPGIGKSTLTLQIANFISEAGKSVLYISGEESEEQIAMRGKRLGLPLKKLKLLSETNLETALATAAEVAPDFLIIDSVQVMNSQAIPGGPGSVSQVRLCTEQILEFAKPRNITALLIGHVTKDGTLAGPRALEHLVDCVLYLEGSRSEEARVLRSVKNRFGSVSEVGIFEMREEGLAEVKNPAELFLRKRSHGSPGAVLVMTVEGSRPIVLEVQALVNPTVFGYPVRKASGFDVNRLQVLAAVLQKHCGLNLGNQDIYINVVSGYRLDDPACDLGVCLAIISSLQKHALPQELVAVGEVGLSGEIHAPRDIEKRKKESSKLGLILTPEHHTIQELVSSLLESKGRNACRATDGSLRPASK